MKIKITSRAEKDLYKLDSKTKNRILKKLKEYSLDPFPHLKKLSNNSIGNFRFRTGDYRVIFDIIENEIVVLRIGHRKEIYK